MPRSRQRRRYPQIDDRGRLARNVGKHASPLLGCEERRGILQDAGAGREVQRCVLQLRGDPFADHTFRLDAVDDPIAQLADVAVVRCGRHRDAHVLDALRAKTRGEVLAQALGIGPDAVGLVQHHELSP